MSLDTILKQRGLMPLKEYDKLMSNQSFISTGYKEIDEIICPEENGGPGGFPRGSLSEICGMSRCGKSRFMRDICMRPEVKALYIDTENALSSKEYKFLKDHGVDVVAEQLLENIWGVVNDAIDEELYDLIVVDSVGATDTQAERDDDNTLSMSTSVQRAKIMSKWLRGIGAHFMVHRRTALVLVNHLKDAVGGFGHQMVKPCGKSIDFHCMVQLQCSGGDSTIKKGTLKDFDVLCTKTRYNIVKQKCKVQLDLNPYKIIKEE